MPEGHEILKEFRMAPTLEPTPSTPYVGVSYSSTVPNLIDSKINHQLLGQDNLDKILRAELSKVGCEVELGVELQHLEQFDDHVKVSLLKHNLDGTKGVEPTKEEESYDWVIGSDGAKGAVRRELGLKLLGETTTYSFITGDFRLEGLESDVSISFFDLSFINLIFLKSEMAPMGGNGGYHVSLLSQVTFLFLLTQNTCPTELVFAPRRFLASSIL